VRLGDVRANRESSVYIRTANHMAQDDSCFVRLLVLLRVAQQRVFAGRLSLYCYHSQHDHETFVCDQGITIQYPEELGG